MVNNFFFLLHIIVKRVKCRQSNSKNLIKYFVTFLFCGFNLQEKYSKVNFHKNFHQITTDFNKCNLNRFKITRAYYRIKFDYLNICLKKKVILF